jgi:large subunit ribosomal protein L1
MPNPKAGTVTMDVTKAVKELKGGRIEFRVDKQSNLAASVGKLSFDKKNITENIRTFADAIVRAKPATAKGTYILAVTLSSTMGPGLKLNQDSLLESK